MAYDFCILSKQVKFWIWHCVLYCTTL